MQKVFPIFAAGAAVVLGSGCGQATARASSSAPPPRQEIELTVYSGGFGLVREVRPVHLTSGTTRVGIPEVSKEMDPPSVLFDWPGGEVDAQVVSTSFEMGVGSSRGLLARFLGREVDLVFHSDTGREARRIRGVLEVVEPGNVVVRAGDRFLINPPATIEAPANGEITTLPQLMAEVSSPKEVRTQLGVSYMTGGLSWSADYVATLPKSEENLTLECWATITNRTGIDFPDATVRFVAGGPNRLAGSDVRRARMAEDARVERFHVPGAAMGGELEAVSTGELYSYPTKVAATIRQEQMNRVRMLGSERVEVARDYGIRLPWLSSGGYSAQPDRRIPATLALTFVNREEDGLGQPLPAGGMRVYEPDERGTLRYIGAAFLPDTPKGAKANLTLSNVFDVYALARVTKSEQVGKRAVRKGVEVTVHNMKSTPLKVRLVQDLYGTPKILSESHKSAALSANVRQWTIEVPAGGETKLTFDVELS
jgi:hypothetical protein